MTTRATRKRQARGRLRPDGLEAAWLAIIEDYRTGSPSERRLKRSHLRTVARTLARHHMPYTPDTLKPQHVERLARLWLKAGDAPGTVKQRLAVLRWVARAANRPGLVGAANAPYLQGSA